MSCRRSSFRIQGPEEKPNEEENQQETNAHKDERLHYERVLLLVDQTIVDFRGHWEIDVDWQQVEVDKLCLTEHQLDVSVRIFEVNCADCAVEQIVAIGRVEDLHVDKAGVLL